MSFRRRLRRLVTVSLDDSTQDLAPEKGPRFASSQEAQQPCRPLPGRSSGPSKRNCYVYYCYCCYCDDHGSYETRTLWTLGASGELLVRVRISHHNPKSCRALDLTGPQSARRGKAWVGMPPYHVSRLRHTPQLAVCNHKDAFQLLFLESAGQKAGQVLSSLRSWPAGSSPRLSSTRLSTKRQTFTVAFGMNGASRDDHAYSSNSDSEEVEAVVVEASVSEAVPDCSKWQSKVRVVVAGSWFFR